MAQKSLSINTPNLISGKNEKSLKSTLIDYPYKTEEEKSPIVRNYSIKKSNKNLISCKRESSIKNEESNIYKIIKKKSIEEKKYRVMSPCRINRNNPRRVYSLKKNSSCKNMYLKSSLFDSKNKIIYITNKKPSSNKDFNNYKNNEKRKKKSKTKNKKTINKTDSLNIKKIKTNSKNEETKDNTNKDKDKINKNFKKFFCCI